MILLTLPYPPSANRYWRSLTIGGKGRVVKSKEAREYRLAVERICAEKAVVPYTGDVCVTIKVYRPRRAGDLDNTMKVPLDALRGLAFEDDNQVRYLAAYRHDDKDNPRVEVLVSELVSFPKDILWGPE